MSALLPPVPKGERSRPVFSECSSEETGKLKSGETVAIGDLPVRYDEQQVVDGQSVTLNLLETKALIFLSTRFIEPAPETAALKIGGAPADTTMKPNDLVTKEWKLPPGFIPAKADGSGPVSAKDFLIANGVKFDGASAATYVPAGNRLIVRNTQGELDLIDQLVEMAVVKGGKAISEDATVLDGGTDEGFLSDMYLYFIGRAPTPEEVRAFAADPKPSREKRKAMVEGLAERLKAGGENAAPPTLPAGTLMVRGRNLVLNKDGQTGTLTLNQVGSAGGRRAIKAARWW